MDAAVNVLSQIRVDRRRSGLLAALLSMVLIGVWLLLPVMSASAGSNLNICDRTNSENNPYVVHGVDTSSSGLQGHAGHTGPVWVAGMKALGGPVSVPV